MNVACGAEARGRYLWEGDTSNKPFEWTGHHQFSATPPQALCLPLKGSVRRIAAGHAKDMLNKIIGEKVDEAIDGNFRLTRFSFF